jgi:hypothetical protein
MKKVTIGLLLLPLAVSVVLSGVVPPPGCLVIQLRMREVKEGTVLVTAEEPPLSLKANFDKKGMAVIEDKALVMGTMVMVEVFVEGYEVYRCKIILEKEKTFLPVTLRPLRKTYVKPGKEAKVAKRGVTIEIPKDACRKAIKIGSKEVKPAVVKEKVREKVVAAYEIIAEDMQTSAPVTQFEKKIKITLSYRGKAVNDEDALQIICVDTGENLGGEVNKRAKTVTAEVSHFSIFAIVEGFSPVDENTSWGSIKSMFK